MIELDVQALERIRAQLRQRIAFLVRGLKWAVKRFEAELPRLDPGAQDVFTRMRDSHLRSIAACERLI